MTEMQCERARANCYDSNIKPILKELQKMNEKLDIVMPTIQEINNMRNAWDYVGNFATVISKIVMWLTIVLGAIYAVKEWIRK